MYLFSECWISSLHTNSTKRQRTRWMTKRWNTKKNPPSPTNNMMYLHESSRAEIFKRLYQDYFKKCGVFFFSTLLHRSWLPLMSHISVAVCCLLLLCLCFWKLFWRARPCFAFLICLMCLIQYSNFTLLFHISSAACTCDLKKKTSDEFRITEIRIWKLIDTG